MIRFPCCFWFRENVCNNYLLRENGNLLTSKIETGPSFCTKSFVFIITFLFSTLKALIFLLKMQNTKCCSSCIIALKNLIFKKRTKSNLIGKLTENENG